MRLTYKDIARILSYLEVTRASTKHNLEHSKPGGAFHDCMKNQLAELEALIQKIESVEI